MCMRSLPLLRMSSSPAPFLPSDKLRYFGRCVWPLLSLRICVCKREPRFVGRPGDFLTGWPRGAPKVALEDPGRLHGWSVRRPLGVPLVVRQDACRISPGGPSDPARSPLGCHREALRRLLGSPRTGGGSLGKSAVGSPRPEGRGQMAGAGHQEAPRRSNRR